ncbi:MAG: DOMON domain-containing protein [Candidatus Odinarchaeota archaeon]
MSATKILTTMFVVLLFLPVFAMVPYREGLSSPSEGLIIYKDSSSPAIDGIINTEEYKVHEILGLIGMDVYFEHNGTHFFVGLKRSSTGFLAIGWKLGTPQMDGSNIVLLAYDTGPRARDDFASGHTHTSDISLGGTDDITDFDVTESGGTTQGEFVYPLTTTDSKDVNIVIGQSYGFIFSYSTGDSFDVKHDDRDMISAVSFSNDLEPSTTSTTSSTTTSNLNISSTTTSNLNISSTTTSTTNGTPTNTSEPKTSPSFASISLLMALTAVIIFTRRKNHVD